MTLNLTNLVAWTRRLSGDRLVLSRYAVDADGTETLQVNTEGYVNILSVVVSGVTLLSLQYTVNGSLITFLDEPEEGESIVVSYDAAVFSDTEILGFLLDAGRSLLGDLSACWAWSFDDTTATIDDDGSESLARPEVVDLLVHAAALGIATEKSIRSADQAIKIRDGDTSIDTSATSGRTEKVVERLDMTYRSKLRRFLSENFTGMGGSN